MSELMNRSLGRNDFHRHLLTTASALALIGNVWSAQDAKADSDADRPTVWIELGGQWEQQTGQGDAYIPPFFNSYSASPVLKPVSPLRSERPPLFSDGGDAKLTFEPSDTDWVFSASVRYGRSVGHNNFSQSHKLTNHVQTTVLYYGPNGYAGYNHGYYPFFRNITQRATEFAVAKVTQKQSHAIVDFTVGKDFGLGMFGRGGVSDFNVGVRFAQFTSKASGTINVRPDVEFLRTCYISYFQHHRFPLDNGCNAGQGDHNFDVTFQNQRSFHGVGPALSWNASRPILGEQPAGVLSVDWGANAALLFGRQRAGGSHQTYEYYHTFTAHAVSPTHYTKAGGFNRSRAVTIPNVGGFAGMSFSFTTVKISVGYRGDFFFGAMDAGNDTKKTEIVGFYGPFATVSIGIGGQLKVVRARFSIPGQFAMKAGLSEFAGPIALFSSIHPPIFAA